MNTRKSLSLFGATGSIGDSTLAVVAEHPDRFQIKGLVAGTQVDKLAALAHQFSPEIVIIADESKLEDLKSALSGWSGEIAAGEAAIIALASEPQDLVVSAITGISGLSSTYAALQAGNNIALANKESLVCAGALMMDLAREKGCDILPLDSEHSAIFQCLNGEQRSGVQKICLTASGGPFRGKTRRDLQHVKREDALAHPNWDMGPKVTIDSASLANKGLEYIEAAYLFDVGTDQLDVVIHPQSIVHSYVTYKDGSTLAQMGLPDMRTPIATALAFPERLKLSQQPLDLVALGTLDFQSVDYETFPALKLAQQAFETSAVAPIVFNAANEMAVEAFLADRLHFLQIADQIEHSLSFDFGSSLSTIDDVWAIDAEVRQKTNILAS